MEMGLLWVQIVKIFIGSLRHFPPFFALEGDCDEGESDKGGVKNGEGKTEKLKMFPFFGGLPRL